MAKVLLIEPDIILGKTSRLSLEQAGHEVKVCHHAQAAIDYLDHQNPDIIVMELQLADHGGIEFIYELRSYPEWQGIPIVVQSLTPQNLFSDNSQQIEKLGVTQYLYKPASRLQQLNRAVMEALLSVPSRRILATKPAKRLA